MQTVSKLYRQAVAYSRSLECTVDFVRNGVGIAGLSPAPVVGGRLSADRGQQVRLNCSVTLAVPEWQDIDLDNNTCRFRVRRGVSSLGRTEAVQLGEFRVDDISRPATGVITVKGSGLEAYLIDARFLSPRTPPYGQSTVTTIVNMIREVLPGVTVLIKATKDRPVRATAVWQRDRMDTIDDLAASIMAEVYCDALGRFVIGNLPDPIKGVPVWVADEGAAGVLVDRSEESSRDRVYNAAVVTGQSSDPDVRPVSGWTADFNPASPTYFYGAFGQKPIFYSSQFFTDIFQCQNYAAQLLLEAMADNRAVSFSQLPADFLEVSDIIGVRVRDGSIEKHLLQSYDMSLGVDGSMDGKTLSSKELVADGV